MLRDSLTRLLTQEVFDLVLEQEALRAQRHQHGVAMILFHIDNLGPLNRVHGLGAGDRILERLGILARRFFRTHDWAARHGDDSIAVLLPETTVDQAAALAQRFRETVQQRLILVDPATDAPTPLSLSAAAVGTDLVQAEIEANCIMSEAYAAVLRAKMNGGNRIERVALQPASVTIAAPRYSFSSYSIFSLATTAGSARVVVSPSALPSAISRSSRRMIFPERVFGKSAAKRI